MITIDRGVAVVIGASGPTAADYDEIDAADRARAVGVISSGNFSITGAMAQAAAVLVARHLPRAEIINYGGDTKADVPTRSTCASVAGVLVHSVRSPASLFRPRSPSPCPTNA